MKRADWLTLSVVIAVAVAAVALVRAARSDEPAATTERTGTQVTPPPADPAVALPPGWSVQPAPDPDSPVVYGDGRVTTLREEQQEFRDRQLDVRSSQDPLDYMPAASARTIAALTDPEWRAIEAAWRARNLAFMADAARQKIMSDTLQVATEAMPNSSARDVFYQAQLIAFRQAGWERTARHIPDRTEALHLAELSRASLERRNEAIRQRHLTEEALFQARRQAEEVQFQAHRRSEEYRYSASVEQAGAAYQNSRADGYNSSGNGYNARSSHGDGGSVEPHRSINSGPAQLRDYNGNTYSQPEGSSFVTDNRTGKQCFKYGDFVRCD